MADRDKVHIGTERGFRGCVSIPRKCDCQGVRVHVGIKQVWLLGADHAHFRGCISSISQLSKCDNREATVQLGTGQVWPGPPVHHSPLVVLRRTFAMARSHSSMVSLNWTRNCSVCWTRSSVAGVPAFMASSMALWMSLAVVR